MSTYLKTFPGHIKIKMKKKKPLNNSGRHFKKLKLDALKEICFILDSIYKKALLTGSKTNTLHFTPQELFPSIIRRKNDRVHIIDRILARAGLPDFLFDREVAGKYTVGISDWQKLKRYHASVIEQMANLNTGVPKQGRVNSGAGMVIPKTTDASQFAKEYTLSVRDREIWINKYLISKPHAVGSNFEFFQYVRLESPNTKIERGKLSGPGSLGLNEQLENKRFFKILNALGFKGEIRKAFFYKVGKDSLYYRGNAITIIDLEEAGVKIPLFIKELELADLKNK